MFYERPDQVLDFGCGTGITTLRLAEIAASITAIDMSGSMIDEAKKKAQAKQIENISFYVGSLTEMSLVYKMLAKLGILPSFSSMTAVGLKTLIRRAGFEIIESAQLFVDPPNIFIAAGKRGTNAQR